MDLSQIQKKFPESDLSLKFFEASCKLSQNALEESPDLPKLIGITNKINVQLRLV